MEDFDMKLLKETGAAKILGVSTPTLRKWRKLGSGPAFKLLCGRVYYAKDALEHFIKAGQV